MCCGQRHANTGVSLGTGVVDAENTAEAEKVSLKSNTLITFVFISTRSYGPIRLYSLQESGLVESFRGKQKLAGSSCPLDSSTTNAKPWDIRIFVKQTLAKSISVLPSVGGNCSKGQIRKTRDESGNQRSVSSAFA